MRVLKKPFVALLLTALLVLSSACFSIRGKIAKESTAVSMGFYNGVEAGARVDPAPCKALEQLCRCCESLVGFAQINGVSADALKEAAASLSYELTTGSTDFSYLHFMFQMTLDEVYALSSQLPSAGAKLEDIQPLLKEIESLRQSVYASPYNQSVRDYVNSLSNYALWLAAQWEPVLPEYFA